MKYKLFVHPAASGKYKTLEDIKTHALKNMAIVKITNHDKNKLFIKFKDYYLSFYDLKQIEFIRLKNLFTSREIWEDPNL